MRNEYESAVLSRILPNDTEREESHQMGKKLIDAVFEVAGVPAMMTGRL